MARLVGVVAATLPSLVPRPLSQVAPPIWGGRPKGVEATIPADAGKGADARNMVEEEDGAPRVEGLFGPSVPARPKGLRPSQGEIEGQVIHLRSL